MASSVLVRPKRCQTRTAVGRQHRPLRHRPSIGAIELNCRHRSCAATHEAALDGMVLPAAPSAAHTTTIENSLVAHPGLLEPEPGLFC